MEIRGKVAIVTGAGGGGCGRAVAARLARDGAAVVVSDINEPGGHETERLIEAAGGRAKFLRADVSVEADVRALVRAAQDAYGGLDILVNNAGPFYHDSALDRWIETVQGNLHGTMYGILHAVEAMKGRGGAIVNIGSTSALGHGRKHSPSPSYDTAKAAIIRLTTTLGWLQEREGIRVNCLVPDWIATEEVVSAVAALTPEERIEWDAPEVLITVEEIVDAVVQLITDETLAGRVMVWWCGQPRRLIRAGDPGYAALE